MNMRQLSFLIALIAFSAPLQPTLANCPFCNAVSQTLRQEIKQMDVAVFASYVSSESDSVGVFQIKRIIKGQSLTQVGEEIRANFFGKGKPDQMYMLMGIDPPDILWSAPLKVSEEIQEYINQIQKLPADDSTARLQFFLKHLGNTDSTISRDVFDEFASASYADMVSLKSHYDRPQLIKWVQDLSLPPDRRKLYLVMLGICGEKSDADILEKLIRSDDPQQQAGLDALIACYLTLKGEPGLPLINENYLANADASYADIYSAVMALRFHGTDGGVIDKKAVTKSLQLLLDRPKLADLVIPDLARWEDWSQVEKIVKLFKESEDSEASWLRIPAIRYLKACPLPEAGKHLEELKQLDPASYKRAMQFFPQPSATDSSLWKHQPATHTLFAHGRPLRNADILASASTPLPSNSVTAKPNTGRNAGLNPVPTASVLATFSATLWLGMWLVITGAGRQPKWFVAWLGR